MRWRGDREGNRTGPWISAAAALLAACGGGAYGFADAGTPTDAAAEYGFADAGTPTDAAPEGGGGDSLTHAAPEGSAGDNLACGQTTCHATWQFCIDSVSDAGETFHCADLPAVCPCPATCASLLGAYSSSNTLNRQTNPACLFDSGASNSLGGSVLSVPLTCSATANGGLTLRGDTFPCGMYESETMFCLSATEYCLEQDYGAGGLPVFGCQRGPSQCEPPSCACLNAAGTIGNSSSSGSSSSNIYGSTQWSCTDDGGVLATEQIP